MPLVVSVEGNIGAGKSTAISKIQATLTALGFSCHVIEEQIAKWRNFHGENLLEQYYKNPKENCFAFQLAVLITLFDTCSAFPRAHVIICDRSLHSAVQIFVKRGLKSGFLTELQHAVLVDLYNRLTPSNYLDAVIYLRTDPKVAYERVAKRGRVEESSIDLATLEEIHAGHEDTLLAPVLQGKPFGLNVPLITVEWNVSLDETGKLISKLCNDILKIGDLSVL